MSDLSTWDLSGLGLRLAFVPIKGLSGPSAVTLRPGTPKVKFLDGIGGFSCVLVRQQKMAILTINLLAASSSNATLTGLELTGAQFPVDLLAPGAGINEVIHLSNGIMMGIPAEIGYGPKAPNRIWQVLCLGITPALLGNFGG